MSGKGSACLCSSVGFALLERLLLLYQPDRGEYESKDRALYFKMEDSPYYIAENQQELEEIILRCTNDEIKENCHRILNFYETKETGRASQKVAEMIHQKITDSLGGK